MEKLEKSWTFFLMVISRPGKVHEKKIPKVLEKSWKCCYVPLHSLIKIIVSQSFASFKVKS